LEKQAGQTSGVGMNAPEWGNSEVWFKSEKYQMRQGNRPYAVSDSSAVNQTFELPNFGAYRSYSRMCIMICAIITNTQTRVIKDHLRRRVENLQRIEHGYTA
jgi:hypothetical protein